MRAWAQLLQARGGGPFFGAPPGSSSPTTTLTSTTASSSFTRSLPVARNGGGTAGGARAAGASSSSVNGSSPPEAESHRGKKRKKSTTTTQKQQAPSVLEVQRAIGVASDGDDGGDGGGRPASVLDFFASTPVGQAESPAERRLREAAEWVVQRTESRGLLGQRILMVVCLNILPVWVFLLLVASGAVKLPFSLPFMDNLLS